ncbi:MAG: S-ribosylhomocysteine lyase [candidate division Zixibacteria bacterium]|nr:S-ribosylhomocysteine lyase [candidate division Zixibacteria bacterium]
MTKSSKIPESFLIDHNEMTAPQVRKAGVQSGPAGDKVSKFDLRFVKPNVGAIPTAAIHTLEHLLATYMKTHLDGVIDISPMGCRTGFYLSIWGDVESDMIKQALIKSLGQILETRWEDVPGTTARECGNYRDHSLFSAKEYASTILEGFKES